MHDLCLINLIVGRGDGEAFLDFLGDQGIKTAHSLPCRGTAGKKLLDLLGLEESEKTLLWAMTSRARAGRLLARLVREMGLDMPGAGIAFTTPVGSVAGATSLRSLTEGQDIIMGEVTDMPAAFLYELIIAIVNRGHADTVMDAARAAGGRCVCVGTTSVRTLETVTGEDGIIRAQSGDTGIFIMPGYTFHATDALITNFHLPQSTLLMLISALMGREEALRVYREAVKERYRFFSFGDAMLIL